MSSASEMSMAKENLYAFDAGFAELEPEASPETGLAIQLLNLILTRALVHATLALVEATKEGNRK